MLSQLPDLLASGRMIYPLKQKARRSRHNATVTPCDKRTEPPIAVKTQAPESSHRAVLIGQTTTGEKLYAAGGASQAVERIHREGRRGLPLTSKSLLSIKRVLTEVHLFPHRSEQ